MASANAQTAGKISLTFVSMGHSSSLTADRYNLRGNMPPAWLHNKVTAEQYDTLALLNMIASVNYDLLKGHNTDKYTVDAVMQQVHKAIDRFTNDTDFNKRTDNFLSGSGYTLTPKIISWQERPKSTVEVRCLLYSSIDGYDAHVVLTATLHKDKKTGAYTSSRYKVEGYSMGGAKVDCQAKLYDHPTDQECQQVTFGKGKIASNLLIMGNITFTDPLGNKHQEQINNNLTLELQP